MYIQFTGGAPTMGEEATANNSHATGDRQARDRHDRFPSMTPDQLERFFLSLPLSVCSFGSLKQITECTLEPLYSIFPRPRGFSSSLAHVSSELFETSSLD